jgi:hypothetical protein
VDGGGGVSMTIIRILSPAIFGSEVTVTDAQPHHGMPFVSARVLWTVLV